MKKNKAIYLVLMLIFAIPAVNSQDLIDILDKELPNDPQYTQATFKANRITFGQSVETRKARVLELNVITKFWNTPNSQSQSFAADRVSGRFGLEYAFSDRFTAGLGVATFDGTFNSFGKYRLIRQRDDHKKAPVGFHLLPSFLLRVNLHPTFPYNWHLRMFIEHRNNFWEMIIIILP